jgi:hypothetical protein
MSSATVTLAMTAARHAIDNLPNTMLFLVMVQFLFESFTGILPFLRRSVQPLFSLEVPQFFRGWRDAPAPSATFITPLPDYEAKKCRLS